MTEQEKRLAGRLYYPPDPELTEARMRAKRPSAEHPVPG